MSETGATPVLLHGYGLVRHCCIAARSGFLARVAGVLRILAVLSGMRICRPVTPRAAQPRRGKMFMARRPGWFPPAPAGRDGRCGRPAGRGRLPGQPAPLGLGRVCLDGRTINITPLRGWLRQRSRLKRSGFPLKTAENWFSVRPRPPQGGTPNPAKRCPRSLSRNDAIANHAEGVAGGVGQASRLSPS
jgi:hypothetical protein